MGINDESAAAIRAAVRNRVEFEAEDNPRLLGDLDIDDVVDKILDDDNDELKGLGYAIDGIMDKVGERASKRLTFTIGVLQAQQGDDD